jgi:hypothetical protein
VKYLYVILSGAKNLIGLRPFTSFRVTKGVVTLLAPAVAQPHAAENLSGRVAKAVAVCKPLPPLTRTE